MIDKSMCEPKEERSSERMRLVQNFLRSIGSALLIGATFITDSFKKAIRALESERDQLRKQVEGQFVAGLRRAAAICDAVSEFAGMRPLRVGANVSRDAILSAASALEQKEQG